MNIDARAAADARHIAEIVPCPFCHAAIGDGCVNIIDRITPRGGWPHQRRLLDAQRVRDMEAPA